MFMTSLEELLSREFRDPIEEAVNPKFDMNFENIKEKLNSILRMDLSETSDNILIDTVNDLFLIYRNFINESILIKAKHTTPLGDRVDKYRNIRNIMNKQIKQEEITDRIEGDKVTEYAYGAYLGNQIAHLFDTYKGVRMKNNPFDDGNFISFSDEFSDGKRNRELVTDAYAIKAMFTAKIIEEIQKDESLKERVYWGKDDDGKYILTLDTMNRDLKGNPITISVHVIDEDLMDYLKQNASRSIEDFNFETNGSKPPKVLTEDILRERD